MLAFESEENGIRWFPCCGDPAEMDMQVEYLHFCGPCRSGHYICSLWKLALGVLAVHPTVKQIDFITTDLGQNLSSDAPVKQHSAFWGEEDVHHSCP